MGEYEEYLNLFPKEIDLNGIIEQLKEEKPFFKQLVNDTYNKYGQGVSKKEFTHGHLPQLLLIIMSKQEDDINLLEQKLTKQSKNTGNLEISGLVDSFNLYSEQPKLVELKVSLYGADIKGTIPDKVKNISNKMNVDDKVAIKIKED